MLGYILVGSFFRKEGPDIVALFLEKGADPYLASYICMT